MLTFLVLQKLINYYLFFNFNKVKIKKLFRLPTTGTELDPPLFSATVLATNEGTAPQHLKIKFSNIGIMKKLSF